MNDAEEKILLEDYLRVCSRLAEGFTATVTEASAHLPMTADRIDRLDYGADSAVLVFMKRFEQFEDALHRTLKVISKVMEHGKIERLTSVDVTHRAHKLGILESPDVWATAVRARNTLAHEYPLNPQKRTNQLNTAWETRTTLIEAWDSIRQFVADEGLL